MPTYEYECQKCHERLEAFQSFSDAPLTTCPSCGGELRKVFSAVGIVFKGSGFYKNDSRRPDKGSTTTPGATSAETSAATAGSSSAPAAPAPAASTPAASSTGSD
jgi:putative FmdB family regulatory protein